MIDVDDAEHERWTGVFKSRGIPKRVTDLLFAEEIDWDCKLLKHAMEWRKLPDDDQRRSSFLLSGKTGRGKTLASSILVSHQHAITDAKLPAWAKGNFSLWERLPGGLMVDASRLATYIVNERYGKDVPSILNWSRITELLVIDDLGREVFDLHGHLKSGMDSLIRQRFDDGLRTIFTSNKPASWIEAQYGGALMDRIKAYGMVASVDSCEYRRSK